MFKYKFYRADNKVIAVSSFAGKPVRGIAKCDPADNFSVENGEELAAARCNNKISAKRVKYLRGKLADACDELAKVKAEVEQLTALYNEAVVRYSNSEIEITEILAKL
jgi:hypothetical protein